MGKPTVQEQATPATNTWKRLALACCLASLSAACAAGGVKSGPAKAPVTPIATYHWYDGTKRRELHVAPGVSADFSAGATTKSGAPVMRKSDGSQVGQSPVFTDAANSATQRALPGGVLVRFKQPMTRESADALLETFETYTVRKIGSSGSFWLVDAPQGMASLDLANRIYESGLVKSASPNWWKQRTKK